MSQWHAMVAWWHCAIAWGTQGLVGGLAIKCRPKQKKNLSLRDTPETAYTGWTLVTLCTPALPSKMKCSNASGSGVSPDSSKSQRGQSWLTKPLYSLGTVWAMHCSGQAVSCTDIQLG